MCVLIHAFILEKPLHSSNLASIPHLCWWGPLRSLARQSQAPSVSSSAATSSCAATCKCKIAKAFEKRRWTLQEWCAEAVKIASSGDLIWCLIWLIMVNMIFHGIDSSEHFRTNTDLICSNSVYPKAVFNEQPRSPETVLGFAMLRGPRSNWLGPGSELTFERPWNSRRWSRLTSACFWIDWNKIVRFAVVLLPWIHFLKAIIFVSKFWGDEAGGVGMCGGLGVGMLNLSVSSFQCASLPQATYNLLRRLCSWLSPILQKLRTCPWMLRIFQSMYNLLRMLHFKVVQATCNLGWYGRSRKSCEASVLLQVKRTSAKSKILGNFAVVWV